MASKGSLAGRALLAVVLLVVFYVIAIGISLALFALGVWLLKHGRGSGTGKGVVFSFITGAVILWSVFPRPDFFEEPGPRLDPKKHPRLFDALRKIARGLGQEMPADVYLVPDVNAFVTQRGGIMGLGSKRVMGLGLPLLQALTVTEMRGVIAHEFGHFVGGDTKLGPWIYKTRSALARTVVNLGDSITSWFFLQYFKMFLRITEAISRAQEYEADAVSAKLVGSRALISGLKKTHGAAPAFNVYMDSEYLPVLGSGFRPPLAEGFGRFLRSKEIATALKEEVAGALRSHDHDPYDSHPPLADRVAALEKLREGAEPPEDDPPALSLLEDVAAAEKELIAMLLKDQAASLKAVKWSETAEKVTIPGWKELLAENGSHLAKVTPESLAGDAKRFTKVGKLLVNEPGADAELHRRAGVSLVGSALGLAL
ncbi:MAG: M48 family metallopeptidase, partial [Planctomycetota bacterium]